MARDGGRRRGIGEWAGDGLDAPARSGQCIAWSGGPDRERGPLGARDHDRQAGPRGGARARTQPWGSAYRA